MKRTISTLLVALLMLATFSTSAQAAKKNDNTVRYTELHNYFHNNGAPIPASPLITTQKDFDEQFGMAARMGKDGQPTPVNFKKQAVLAIVLPETNFATTIDSVVVRESGKNELTLAYTVHEGMKYGYTTQPISLLAIDKKYKGYTVKTDSKIVKDVCENTTAYEFYSYNDKRNDIYLNVDYPTKGNEQLLKAVRSWIARQLVDMANGFSLSDMGHRSEIARLADADLRTFMQTYVNNIIDSMAPLNVENAKYSEMRASLDATISRMYEDDKVVSFESNGYNYTGGAHGISFCYGATFDKATGKQLTLVKDSLPLRKLITDRLHKSMNMQGLHFEKEPVPMPQAAPYLVGDGRIKFVYQPYEIGPYALGKPECIFDLYEIEDYLTNEGKQLEQ